MSQCASDRVLCEIVQKVLEWLHDRNVYSYLSNATYQPLWKVENFWYSVKLSQMSTHRYSMAA